MPHATEGDLHAYLDGALPAIDPAAARELSAHLSRCADCRALLEEERSVRERAGELLSVALPPVEVPPFADLERSVSPGATGGRRMERLAWAAGIVIALGAGWIGNAVLRDSPGLERPAVLAEAEPVRTVPVTRDALAEEAEVDGAGATSLGAATDAEAPVGTDVSVAAREQVDLAEQVAPASEPAESRAGERRRDGSLGPADTGRLAARQEVAASPGSGTDLRQPADEPEASPALQSAASEVLADSDAGFADAELASELSAEWTPVDEDAASRLLGRSPVRVADLEVVGYEARAANGTMEVRVRQSLPAGEPLEIVQQVVGSDVGAAKAVSVDDQVENVARDNVARGRAAQIAEGQVTELQDRIDGLLVTVRGALASDSLAVLLSRIR